MITLLSYFLQKKQENLKGQKEFWNKFQLLILDELSEILVFEDTLGFDEDFNRDNFEFILQQMQELYDTRGFDEDFNRDNFEFILQQMQELYDTRGFDEDFNTDNFEFILQQMQEKNLIEQSNIIQKELKTNELSEEIDIFLNSYPIQNYQLVLDLIPYEKFSQFYNMVKQSSVVYTYLKNYFIFLGVINQQNNIKGQFESQIKLYKLFFPFSNMLQYMDSSHPYLLSEFVEKLYQYSWQICGQQKSVQICGGDQSQIQLNNMLKRVFNNYLNQQMFLVESEKMKFYTSEKQQFQHHKKVVLNGKVEVLFGIKKEPLEFIDEIDCILLNQKKFDLQSQLQLYVQKIQNRQRDNQRVSKIIFHKGIQNYNKINQQKISESPFDIIISLCNYSGIVFGSQNQDQQFVNDCEIQLNLIINRLIQQIINSITADKTPYNFEQLNCQSLFNCFVQDLMKIQNLKIQKQNIFLLENTKNYLALLYEIAGNHGVDMVVKLFEALFSQFNSSNFHRIRQQNQGFGFQQLIEIISDSLCYFDGDQLWTETNKLIQYIIQVLYINNKRESSYLEVIQVAQSVLFQDCLDFFKATQFRDDLQDKMFTKVMEEMIDSIKQNENVKHLEEILIMKSSHNQDHKQ
ncbi:hypothetical protein TTHERM_00083900 (macronuclear) [Tetrahymena thermophila SB210]|uniref:Uncharacterized protein n=1 Tax=Tetrahymena thermophila (strain SB210) TaxID=312017 RepID=Q236V9_TETTS|nr:hypothetical protein TTHERM_00083900 [Tetrahymena thermophila SB210]EAR92391.2 hypothetical protein TTHERM_00083900 [Tetrahymena thermophila SB210]|eukprot:XP_001012636.2 hypothetical protein TTHERM_00083900 [Tetrahymena thermophila SB210]